MHYDRSCRHSLVGPCLAFRTNPALHVHPTRCPSQSYTTRTTPYASWCLGGRY
ncbi:hypothetical protein BD311DRAFT_766378 [Dichomitus squalens]|uniref:Uncharacterized protein n=1 Tax=Dichomitus squalens TaxID=114155 RepID=A0A4Q9MEK1_9APHY|nr:hypothetical protein BD311DRAFT_766378 [Dichomitus squalens]